MFLMLLKYLYPKRNKQDTDLNEKLNYVKSKKKSKKN